MTMSVREAARLLYKALHLTSSPSNDLEYRELLARYRADGDFAGSVQDLAAGLEIVILDMSERGLVIAPASRDSRFSLRISDLRQHLSKDQKIALALSHLAICAVFFPSTDRLEDETKTPLPATVARFRDTLLSIVSRFAEAPPSETSDSDAEEIIVGWQLLKRLPATIPRAERASTSSVDGFIKIALKQMAAYGLVRLERDNEDEAQALYTATHRLRVHLRELTLPGLFQLMRDALPR